MKKAIYLIIVLPLLIGSCGGNNDFKRVDYFKAENNDRIFLIETQVTDMATIGNYARRLMHSDGRQTTAFFYSNPAHIIKVSARPNYNVALDIATETDYFIRFDKFPTGNTRLAHK